MPLNFTTTNKAGSDHGVKILTYGQSGMGKTTLAATAPAPIILSAEAGLLSLRDYNIPVIEITSIDDLIDANRWCYQSKEAQQFETLCVDSITEIGEVVLSNSKKTVKDPRQAYGELLERMTDTIKSFRDIKGKHVYMVAKMEAKQDETGMTKYLPAMPGSKLGQQLPYLFDEVFRLGINKTQQGEGYRFLQTQPDFQYEAKDRSNKLDPVEKPDLSYIINKILGVKNGTA